jgi:hypothetical protein
VDSPDHGRVEVHRMERMIARAFDPSDDTIRELDERIAQLEQRLDPSWTPGREER